jgi:uncharacterized cupin superfamily protein
VSLDPGVLVAAATLPLDHDPLPADQIVDGAPTTGIAVLAEGPDHEIGVWEMTPGTATDVEADEIFVVIAGRGTVRFDAVPDGPLPAPIELMPGAVVRLTAGMHTTWTIIETLRKVYVA